MELVDSRGRGTSGKHWDSDCFRHRTRLVYIARNATARLLHTLTCIGCSCRCTREVADLQTGVLVGWAGTTPISQAGTSPASSGLTRTLSLSTTTLARRSHTTLVLTTLAPPFQRQL